MLVYVAIATFVHSRASISPMVADNASYATLKVAPLDCDKGIHTVVYYTVVWR